MISSNSLNHLKAVCMGFLCRSFLALCLVVASLPVVAAITGADAFFTYPDTTAANLSPAGDQVALISYKDGNQRLSVLNLADGKTTTLLELSELSEDDAIVSAIAWIDDTQLAVQYSEARTGVDRLTDTRRKSYLLIAQLPTTPGDDARLLRVRTKGRMVNTLPAEPNVFLYAKSGSYSHVYRISTDKLTEVGTRLGKLDKVDGGQFVSSNRVASVDGFATRWFIDSDGIPQAALTVNSRFLIKLNRLTENGEFTVLKQWGLSDHDEETDEPLDSLIPLLMSDNNSVFYCLSTRKDERNAIFKVDFVSSTKTLVYQNDSYAINSVITNRTRDNVIGVRVLKDGALQNVYLGEAADSETSALMTTIDAVIDTSADQSSQLRYREGHAEVGHYVLQRSGESQEQVVGAVYPRLLNQLDSQLVEGSVAVEGLHIPYLLTLPTGAGNAPYPMVVMPHGGPIGIFDDRYFDPPTQFLAANGFAVLRVNYRGSSGYGKALRDAGKREWAGLILKDIHAAALAAMARPDINGARVCVFGASYGGYAALMLAIQHPEVYRCASSLAGVTDINLYLATPYASYGQREWLKEFVGDRREDYDALKLASPAYLAAELSQPLQLAHGSDDRIVDVEHAYRMHLALQQAGKPHEFTILEDQGHQIEDLEQRQAFFEALVAFLMLHLQPGSR